MTSAAIVYKLLYRFSCVCVCVRKGEIERGGRESYLKVACLFSLLVPQIVYLVPSDSICVSIDICTTPNQHVEKQTHL